MALIRQCDDSDGLLGSVLSDIAAIHLAAAKKGGLPPADLAHSLFDLQAQDGFGFFSLEPYVRALGKEGLAVYRKLAADAWKNVPPLEPGARASGAASARRPRPGTRPARAARLRTVRLAGLVGFTARGDP